LNNLVAQVELGSTQSLQFLAPLEQISPRMQRGTGCAMNHTKQLPRRTTCSALIRLHPQHSGPLCFLQEHQGRPGALPFGLCPDTQGI
jgi:hypothetical protein